MILDPERISKGIETAKRLKRSLAEVVAPVFQGEHTAAEMAVAMLQIRDLREAFIDALSELVSEPSRGPTYLKLTQEIIPEAFEREELRSINLDLGYRITINTNYRASIKPAQRERAHGWLKDNDLGDLIIPTVNAQTLSAAGKAMLEAGKELPEDFFHCYFQKNTSVTKVGEKKDKAA